MWCFFFFPPQVKFCTELLFVVVFYNRGWLLLHNLNSCIWHNISSHSKEMSWLDLVWAAKSDSVTGCGVQRMNERALCAFPTCVGISQPVAEGGSSRITEEDTAPLTLLLSSSTVTGAALSAFIAPLPGFISFQISPPPFSLLSLSLTHCISSCYPPLSLAFSSPSTSFLPLPRLVWEGS